MKNRKMVFVVFTLIIMTLSCSCNKNQKENKSNVSYDKGTWTNNMEGIQISNDRIHIKNNTIVKIDNIYQKEEKLIIPKGVERIDASALKYRTSASEKNSNFTSGQTLHLIIPNKLTLVGKNFVGSGPVSVSFEEGRKKIEGNAFREAGCNGRCFKVILPDSCKVIEEYAFYDYKGKLQLNTGLKRIEAYALSRTTCDLPDSVEYLGDCALKEWKPEKYTTTSKTADIKDFRLPASLKYIGNECIEFVDMYPSNIVVIPKNVEHIGKKAFRYLTCADVPKKRMPHVRYKVAKGNKWFYIDKDGEIHKFQAI